MGAKDHTSFEDYKGGANSNISYHKNIIDNIHINRPSDHPISLEFNPANNKLYAES